MSCAEALPRIGIVTPSYNQAEYLPETIESVLAQNYPNLEYIVIDGASTDGSIDIIRRYDAQLAYWCSEPDRGQSDAIMKGFSRFTGELFAWINSDDILLPGCLQTVAEAYVRQEKPDIIHTNICYIDSESRITRFIRVPCQSRFFFSRGVWHVSAPTVFFKASLFRDVGGLDFKYHLCMDLDLWVRMMNRGARIGHVEEYLGGFRWHESSKSTAASKERSICYHPEAVEIFGGYVPNYMPGKLALWRSIYKLYQVVNLNYARAYFCCRKAKGKKWWSAFDNIPSESS